MKQLYQVPVTCETYDERISLGDTKPITCLVQRESDTIWRTRLPSGLTTVQSNCDPTVGDSGREEPREEPTEDEEMQQAQRGGREGARPLRIQRALRRCIARTQRRRRVSRCGLSSPMSAVGHAQGSARWKGRMKSYLLYDAQ